MNGKIALNYIYLSPHHAGGKDQVGLNLLKGFYENKDISDICIICFEYSEKSLRCIAPGAEIIVLKSPRIQNELQRYLYICYTNTILIPKIIRKYKISLLFHLSCNTGIHKQRVTSVVLPHDIKQIAHRKLPGLTVPFYKYILFKIMYYMDFKLNDGIIAISEVDRREIQTCYPSCASKVFQIYNPIDCACFHENGTCEAQNIIAINLQFLHKNVITLIKAFEKVKEKIDDNLILVGDVPERVSFLKEYVIKNNLQKRVKFTGFLSDSERISLLQKSRLYVNPTLYEGFGMTAVEAMILAVPVLVSKIETNYEVTLGMCEYYEPAEDSDILAAKILECMDKPIKDMDLEKISQQIYGKYNYKIIAKQYRNYFMRMIGK